MVRPRCPFRPPKAFATLAREALSAAGVFDRTDADIIVLQRVAYGAGNTDWYRVRGPEMLTALCHRLRPGSWISFYFDNRIAKVTFDASARAALQAWALRDTDAVLLTIVPDDFEFDYWAIGGEQDLADLESDGDLKAGDEVYIGPYPAPDNDGTNAITVMLPDEDGVVRGHAY